MPRVKAKAAATTPVEPIKPVEPEEQVELDDPEELNDPEEIEEEEVEYEEVEEEIEEEEEEEVEEEEEEEEEEATVENGADAPQDAYDEDKMKVDEKDDDESKKHAELLALPPHGSEVYVGSIPHDATEKDLKSFCETIGEVTEVRLMKGNDSKENKGYGFVAFKTKELASKAIEDLNNAEFMGRKIKVSSSQAKNKLFIGNVPRIWTEDDIRKVVTKVGPGVTVVELVKDAQNSSRNRGFAFIEYYNHACAEYSRKKMSTKFKLDSNTPTVSWADSKSADTTSQVKAVYVKNLPKDVTQDQLKDLFKRHGEVTKIILPPAKSGQEKSRYGFVHFAERSMAMSAIKDTEKYELDGQVLECSLAKPPSEKKSDSGSTAQKALLPAYPPRGYGLMGAGYGVAANYGVAPFGQPMMYGGAPAPAGVAMVPMVLPDGRLGYVLQQPGVPPAPQQRSGGNRGGNSSGAKQGGDSNRGGRRYRPY